MTVAAALDADTIFRSAVSPACDECCKIRQLNTGKKACNMPEQVMYLRNRVI